LQKIETKLTQIANILGVSVKKLAGELIFGDDLSGWSRRWRFCVRNVSV